MPRPYPPEFRARAGVLVRAGKQVKQTAVELGIHPVTLSNWIRQDDIDNARRLGVPSSESAQPPRQWLTGLIREAHVTSHGTNGYRRVHAELTMTMGVTVSEPTVHTLMPLAGIYGLPGPIRTT